MEVLTVFKNNSITTVAPSLTCMATNPPPPQKKKNIYSRDFWFLKTVVYIYIYISTKHCIAIGFD